MTTEFSDFPPFSAMLKRALGDQLDPGVNSFMDMLADDAVMEFPYAPNGRPKSVAGREALRSYLGAVAALLVFDEIGEPQVRRTMDPAVTVLEYTGHGRVRATGMPYRQDYISVITIVAGRITHFRDYWNPLALRPESTNG